MMAARVVLAVATLAALAGIVGLLAAQTGRNDLARHIRVVILDQAARDVGPWVGQCLELYPGHPICAIDDRMQVSGQFYPATPSK